MAVALVTAPLMLAVAQSERRVRHFKDLYLLSGVYRLASWSLSLRRVHRFAIADTIASSCLYSTGRHVVGSKYKMRAAWFWHVGMIVQNYRSRASMPTSVITMQHAGCYK